jgi:hypothetical protein
MVQLMDQHPLEGFPHMPNEVRIVRIQRNEDRSRSRRVAYMAKLGNAAILDCLNDEVEYRQLDTSGRS